MTQAQVSRGNASFKFTACTPEEIDELANATYIKYKNSSTLHKGLYVSYVRTGSYYLYYTYNQTDDYNSSGVMFQKTTYNENYKPTQVDNYSEGILTKSKITTYDELGRTYGENIYGDVNVINKTKIRSRGLTFSGNFTLNFEYSLKSLCISVERC